MALKIKVEKDGKTVGGIVLDSKGFRYHTENKELIKVLEKVKKDGVNIMGGGEEDGIMYDNFDTVKVTDSKGVNELHNHILNADFDCKVEKV